MSVLNLNTPFTYTKHPSWSEEEEEKRISGRASRRAGFCLRDVHYTVPCSADRRHFDELHPIPVTNKVAYLGSSGVNPYCIILSLGSMDVLIPPNRII